jgi:hypothetical protein
VLIAEDVRIVPQISTDYYFCEATISIFSNDNGLHGPSRPDSRTYKTGK